MALPNHSFFVSTNQGDNKKQLLLYKNLKMICQRNLYKKICQKAT